MILDIKGRTKEKGIKIVGILLGICLAAVSLFYFFHTEKAEAEKRMVEIVNYVKVQCSTYTHYNESSESKSLLRARAFAFVLRCSASLYGRKSM